MGLPVTVLEKASSARMQGGAAIALWGNALRALDAIGAAAPLREQYLPLQR